ncbi:TPA: conjugal transfer protein TraE, partial [Citrobacter freundii]|nr:conjugal transfer protein TraE [Citrobacter freundii]HCA1381748.1 conjugal transfer protein TraE [Citrobacter freundii]HCA1656787.1 conjugal transfer protein TraE [Citrobacter freundii]HCA2132012.1 conjugal transfer protein TraE [Citrobacter freundii]HCA2263157.1 conjugal transfer protein TraE [Citrobacter freundii]
MKLKIKGERDKQLSYAFIALASLLLLSGVGNVLTGSLAWHFATTQKTVTTPMSFNQPFTSDASGADATGMTMFASAFIYWRLNVSPENVDNNQKMLLGFVPSAERDELKKA